MPHHLGGEGKNYIGGVINPLLKDDVSEIFILMKIMITF